MEHAIPEKFFNNPAKCNLERTTTPNAALPACPQGISAVKAIALATSQGQKIYTITPQVYQANPNIVNANLNAHSSQTRQAVQNALDVGHVVTIHEKPITQSGWTGAGYTTIDPETGAGGYMIDGALNGGILEFIDNLQKYLFTPHITGFATGAGYASFANNFANFAGLFSFVVDILSFMDSCTGDQLTAAILMWTILSLMTIILLYLIAAIFVLSFMTMLVLGIGANLISDFWLKPVIVEKSC